MFAGFFNINSKVFVIFRMQRGLASTQKRSIKNFCNKFGMIFVFKKLSKIIFLLKQLL